MRYNGFMSSIRINRKIVFLVLVIIFLTVAGFFASKFLFEKRGEAKEFIGQVQKVKDNMIWARGVFINPDKPELAKEVSTKEVEIKVLSETVIVKILMHMPTFEELKKTGGKWNPADLKQEETLGILADLTDGKNGLTIRVISDKNIFNKTKFIAKRIEFIEQVYPDGPQ